MKKLISLTLVFVLAFSVMVIAAPETDSEQDVYNTEDNEEVEIAQYLKKDITAESDIDYVRFVSPKENEIEVNSDSFKFSALAPVDSGLCILLLIYDDETGKFVPQKREISEKILDENDEFVEKTYTQDTVWCFGYSGYLGEEVKLTSEGEYFFRFVVYHKDTLREEFEYAKNIQVHDIKVKYTKVEDFNETLYKNFWEIYINNRKSFLDILKESKEELQIPKVQALPELKLP